MTKSIQSRVEYWQQVLNLNHWRISYSEEEPRDGHLMETKTIRSRNIARILIAPSTLELPQDEVDKLLIHELLHVVMDPVVEEWGMQGPHSEKDTIRFWREVERSIEHLSQIVASLHKETVPF